MGLLGVCLCVFLFIEINRKGPLNGILHAKQMHKTIQSRQLGLQNNYKRRHKMNTKQNNKVTVLKMVEQD